MTTSSENLLFLVTADVENFTKALRGVQKDIRSVSKDFKRQGADWNKNVTLPILAVGAAVFMASEAVDSGLDAIRVGTNATGDSLKGLQEDFKAVFRGVPNSAEQTGEALALVHSRLGLTGEALQETTRQMLDFSRIAKIDVSTVVANATRVFGDWSIATEDQTAAMDMLFKVSQTTGAAADQLMARVVQFGAPLRQMGFSFQEAATLLGKFEAEGVNTELVMGSMRQALMRFARAGESAPQALRRVMEEIVNMKDPTMATARAMEIFGARAGADMAAAIREGRFEIDELMATLDGSDDTISAASRATWGLVEMLPMLKNQASLALAPLGALMIGLLEKAIPVMANMVAGIEKAVIWFSGLDPVVRNTIFVFFGFLASIGPVMSAIAGLVGALSMLFSPLGLIVVAIGLVIAAGVLLYKNWDYLKSKALEFVNKIRDYFTRLRDGVVSRIEAARTAIVDLKNKMLSVLRTIDLYQIGRDIIQGLISGVLSMLGRVRDAIAGVANRAVDTFKNVLGIRSPSKVGVELGVNYDEGIALGIKKATDMVADASTDMALSVTGPAAGKGGTTGSVRLEHVFDFRNLPAGVDADMLRKMFRETLEDPRVQKMLDFSLRRSQLAAARGRGVAL